MTFDDVFDRLSARGDEAVILGPEGEVMTGADILARRAVWRAELARLGLGPSLRLATLLPNGTEALSSLLTLPAELSLAPMNPAALPDQIVAGLERADAQAVLLAEGDPLVEDLANLLPPDTTLLTLSSDGQLDGAPIIAAGPHAPGLVLHTSGSTGSPKRVPLSPGALLLSARNIADHLNLSETDIATHALPMFHVGAVVDLALAPILGGGKIRLARDLSAPALIQALRAGATWLQLVPTALAHLVEALEADPLPDHDLRFVRMVSADLPEALRLAAEETLGVPVIQMYGMTETAGQITSNPLPPAARKPLSVGVVAGPNVALIDAHGALVETGGEGEVCIRGATVTQGYEGKAATPRHGDWLRSGDLGRFDEEGYLFLTGRVKEIINRGGEKISPLAIERAARALPGIAEAVAFALPHPTLGEQVGLAVLADEPFSEEALLDALSHRLAEFEMPRRITRLDALPRLASGKVDRKGIAAIAAREEGHTAALDSLAQIVSDTWVATLTCRAPHAQADFFDDGGDSLSATDFLMTLEQKLGRQMPPNLLFEAPRFDQLCTRLRDADAPRAQDPYPWMGYLRTNMASWKGQRVGPHKIVVAQGTMHGKTKIIFGGHGAQPAQGIAKHAAADHPVYMLRTLRGYTEDHHALFGELSVFYSSEIAALLEPGEEIIIGGYCGGGLLMGHVADALIARGHPVQRMLAIDLIFEAPTSYPVLYLGSEHARHSMTARYMDPARAARAEHPEGIDFTHVPAGHMAFIQAKTLKKVAPDIRPFLEGDFTPTTAQSYAAPANPARQSAQIKMSRPRRLPKSQTRDIKVRVTNTSAEIWPATRHSGLFLSADFYAWDGDPLAFRADSFELEKAIAPGESFETTLRVTWPKARRRFPIRLRVSMVEDGVTRFGPEPGFLTEVLLGV